MCVRGELSCGGGGNAFFLNKAHSFFNPMKIQDLTTLTSAFLHQPLFTNVLPPSPLQSRGRSQLSAEWTRHLLICFLWVIKSVERRVLLAWWADLPLQTVSQILEVLYFATANFEYKVRGAFSILSYACLEIAYALLLQVPSFRCQV